jgi:hypothetical protein
MKFTALVRAKRIQKGYQIFLCHKGAFRDEVLKVC